MSTPIVLRHDPVTGKFFSSKKLFVDDIRLPEHVLSYNKNPIYGDTEWDIVGNYDEFVEYIQKNRLPNIISLDYDLSDEGSEYDNKVVDYKEKTGEDCLEWLIKYCEDNILSLPEIIYTHSENIKNNEKINLAVRAGREHLRSVRRNRSSTITEVRARRVGVSGYQESRRFTRMTASEAEDMLIRHQAQLKHDEALLGFRDTFDPGWRDRER